MSGSASSDTGQENLDVGSLTPVLPVPDLTSAVAFWTSVLGVAPTFVDGERWAQFDFAGRRLALAGTDAVTEYPALMIKAHDLESARERLAEAGAAVSEPHDGPHERRFTASSPGSWELIVYSRRNG
jgi:predicted enzyme related to lactoylglutathione lyase